MYSVTVLYRCSLDGATIMLLTIKFWRYVNHLLTCLLTYLMMVKITERLCGVQCSTL